MKSEERGTADEGIADGGESACAEVGDVWNSAKSSSSSSSSKTFKESGTDEGGSDLEGGGRGAGSTGTLVLTIPFEVYAREDGGGGNANGDDVLDGTLVVGSIADTALGNNSAKGRADAGESEASLGERSGGESVPECLVWWTEADEGGMMDNPENEDLFGGFASGGESRGAIIVGVCERDDGGGGSVNADNDDVPLSCFRELTKLGDAGVVGCVGDVTLDNKEGCKVDASPVAGGVAFMIACDADSRGPKNESRFPRSFTTDDLD